MPHAKWHYEQGEIVKFGRLAVSDKGLHSGTKVLEWHDIKGVKIKDGYISVSKRGKWLNWSNIAASSIPNLSVFLTLVDEIIGIQAVADAG